MLPINENPQEKEIPEVDFEIAEQGWTVDISLAIGLILRGSFSR